MEIWLNPFSSCHDEFSCTLSNGKVLHAELALAYPEIGEGGIPLRSKSYVSGPFDRLIYRLTADHCTAKNKFFRFPVDRAVARNSSHFGEIYLFSWCDVAFEDANETVARPTFKVGVFGMERKS